MNTEKINELWQILTTQNPNWGRVQTAVRHLMGRHEDWVQSQLEYFLPGPQPYFGLRIWSTEGHPWPEDLTTSVYSDGVEVIIPLKEGGSGIGYEPDLECSGFFAYAGSGARYKVSGAGSLVRWTDEETGALHQSQCPTALLVELYKKYVPRYFDDLVEYSTWSNLQPDTLSVFPSLSDKEALAEWERALLEGDE